MLHKLGDHIAGCYARAAEAERRAAQSPDEITRTDHEEMARTWRHLARSYEFIESLERFLLDADRARSALEPQPPAEK